MEYTSKPLFTIGSIAALLAVSPYSIAQSPSKATPLTTKRQSATVTVNDSNPYHVHMADSPTPLKIKLEHDATGSVRYQWRDYKGRPLTEMTNVTTGHTLSVQLPGTAAGYYGLYLQSDPDIALPNRQAGEAREYGFSILPPRTLAARSANPVSQFGMVHVDRNDPYMPIWIKTATWKSRQSEQWQAFMQERTAVGTLELPLMVGNEWEVDDSKRLSLQHLQRLKEAAKRYFQADPNILYWELGIEENLGKRYKQGFYWPNLAAKVKAVKEVAREVNPNIKLMYQIAEPRMKDIEAFFQSEAAKSFDIIALHPYAWPDFPTPDTWLVDYLQQSKAMMAANKLSMPIWFSEVGAPHHGNAPGAFFGYPKDNKQVPGQTRAHAPAYMIKLHTIALQQGVEKVFWYNYQDRHVEREYAENHFGLRDYWGFPKPVYPAYYTLHSHLDYKTAAGSQQIKPGVQVHKFKGTTETTWVIWSYPAKSAEVALTAIDSQLGNESRLEILNMVGTPIKLTDKQIKLDQEPVFITLKIQ